MRLALATTLVAVVTATMHASPEPRQFRFERAIGVSRGPAPSACAVLDGAVYQHSRASLDDVRLFSGAAEVPYALTMSNTSYLSPAGEEAKVLNLGFRDGGGRDGHIVFDLAMPARAYTSVDLDLKGENFLATARVTGSAEPGSQGTDLGSDVLFDLTGLKLGRNTELRLQESVFPFLHVDLAVSAAGGHNGVEAEPFRASPAMVAWATVPASREAQTIYTEVARTVAVEQQGRETVARFRLPARVPVERVRFEMASADHINFSRTVTVQAHPVGAPAEEREALTGVISRIRLTEGGREVREQSLNVAATLGANARQPAEVMVSVENGDDHPLQIAAVVLEMRQRKLCFDVPAGPLAMFYGDAGLDAPRYDFSRTFQPSGQVRQAALGTEELNSEYVPRADMRSLPERHPELVWLALLVTVGVLGLLAFQSSKRVGG